MGKYSFILSLLFILLYLASALFLVLRRNKMNVHGDKMRRRSIVSFLLSAILLASNLDSVSTNILSLAFTQITSLTLFLTLTSSFLKESLMQVFLIILFVWMSVLTLLNLLSSLGIISVLTNGCYLSLIKAEAIAIMCAQILLIWLKLRSIREIIKNSEPWSHLSFSVDMAYSILLNLALTVFIIFVDGFGPACSAYLVSTFISFMILAQVFRIMADRLMILHYHIETGVLHSLNVSEPSSQNQIPAPDSAYAEIYDRVLVYFENEAPYLNSSLIIDDLVKVIYSNKLYISKAISIFGGKNFCQFVNYYRVKYSVEAFRNNPELKVSELASMSGFNSAVSYTAAFKLVMKENPSDWIRKERSCLAKKKFEEGILLRKRL